MSYHSSDDDQRHSLRATSYTPIPRPSSVSHSLHLPFQPDSLSYDDPARLTDTSFIDQAMDTGPTISSLELNPIPIPTLISSLQSSSSAHNSAPDQLWGSPSEPIAPSHKRLDHPSTFSPDQNASAWPSNSANCSLSPTIQNRVADRSSVPSWSSPTADEVQVLITPQLDPAQEDLNSPGGSGGSGSNPDGTGANPIIVLDEGPAPQGASKPDLGSLHQRPRTRRPYKATTPPSPFLHGWLSVNQHTYPYQVPETFKWKPAPATSCAPILPHSSHPLGLPDDTSHSTDSAIPSRILKLKEPNTKVLFIPKSQSSQKPKKKLGDHQPMSTADVLTLPTALDDNGSKDDSVMVEDDPFLNWGAESVEPAPDQVLFADTLPTAEEPPATTDRSVPECFKPLKLDANLLEIIVRAVVLDLKLLDCRRDHKASIDLLDRFRQLSAGLHPGHQKLYNARLDDYLVRVQGVQDELDRCLATLKDDVRTRINELVVTHHHILHDSTVSRDNWTPKPVEYLDELQACPAPAGTSAPAIHSSRLQAIQEDTWADASGTWGGADDGQPARTGNAGAPDATDPWGCPEPLSKGNQERSFGSWGGTTTSDQAPRSGFGGNPGGGGDGTNFGQDRTQDRGWGGRGGRGEYGSYENGRRGRGYGGEGRGEGGYRGRGRGFRGEGRGRGGWRGGASQGFSDHNGGGGGWNSNRGGNGTDSAWGNTGSVVAAGNDANWGGSWGNEGLSSASNQQSDWWGDSAGDDPTGGKKTGAIVVENDSNEWASEW